MLFLNSQIRQCTLLLSCHKADVQSYLETNIFNTGMDILYTDICFNASNDSIIICPLYRKKKVQPKFISYRNNSGVSKESSQSSVIPHKLTQAAGLWLGFAGFSEKKIWRLENVFCDKNLGPWEDNC